MTAMLRKDRSANRSAEPRPGGAAARSTPVPPKRRDRRPVRRSDAEADMVAAHCLALEALVAQTFQLTRADLHARSRCEAPIAFARQVAMYVAHVRLALPLTEVGRRFGRDRTTVAHACRVVEDRREDPRLDRLVATLENAADLWLRLSRDVEAR